FLVAPGSDPQAIAMRFQGADSIDVDDQGDLLLRVDGADIRQHKPVIYQVVDGRKQIVSGDYIMRDGQSVGFRLADYDRNRPLIIDPILSFSTLIGGSGGGIFDSIGKDQGNAIAIDSAGNAYITGSTTAADFPVVNNSNSKNHGGKDLFVAKLNAASNALSYSAYFGGSSDDAGFGIAVDAMGNAYVAGMTYSYDFPVLNAPQQVLKGDIDGFALKLNAAGNGL